MPSPAVCRRSVLALLLLAASAAAGQPPAPEQVRAVLRARIPASGAAPRLALAGEAFRGSPSLACFYQRRDFAPAWSEGGALRPAVAELLAALAGAPEDGLRAEDYRPAALARLAAAVA